MVGEKTNPISRSCVNGGANPHLILLGVIFGGLDFNKHFVGFERFRSGFEGKWSKNE